MPPTIVKSFIWPAELLSWINEHANKYMPGQKSATYDAYYLTASHTLAYHPLEKRDELTSRNYSRNALYRI